MGELRTICKTCDNKAVKQRRLRNPQQTMYQRLKRKSILKKAILDFSHEDYLFCLQHFKNQCCYCSKAFDENNIPTLDHIVPITKQQYIKHNKQNIILCCHSCNSSKNNKDLIYWLYRKFNDNYLNILYNINYYLYIVELNN